MGWFHDNSDEAQAHAEVMKGPHKASMSHELIAAAASFAAAKAYEKHVEKSGKPVNHKAAVEILAGLTGGIIDRIVETKGLDRIDKEKAKHDATKRAAAKLTASGEY